MDGTVLENLASILDEQAEVYESLVELSRRKQRIIVRGGSGEFEAILEGEQALVWQAGRLEEMRLGLQQRLAGHLNLSPEELTMSRVLERCEEPMGGRLKALQKRIFSVLGELGRLNEVNTQLLKKSLSYITAAMEVLNRDQPSSVTYTPAGETSVSKEPRRFLNHRA